MNNKKRNTIYAVAIVLAGATAFLFLRSYILSRVGDSIAERFASLKVSGFNISYDSISIDWLKNSIDIEHVVLEKNAYDTSCVYPEFIAVANIKARGFRLFPLLMRNKISFETIHLEKPHMVLRKASKFLVDSASQRANEFTLEIDHLSLTGARIDYTDSSNCDLITAFQSNISLREVHLDFHVDQPFVFEMAAATIDSTQLSLPQELYTVRVKHVSMDVNSKTLMVDSLSLIPDAGKIAFGRTRGFEIDRYDCVIPRMRLNGISLDLADSAIAKAQLAELQFTLKIFRDKRLPFRNPVKALPIAQLQSLPFGFQIDSLKISDSFVQYEEFAEEAEGSGTVWFEHLQAIIFPLDNRSFKGSTAIRARAMLMGQGNIRLFATLPWDPSEKTQLEGSLQNFPMPEINSMLRPSTNIEVASGDLDKLSFAFAYDDTKSEGKIELNYKDLKLITFKDHGKNGKNKKEPEPDKDNLKTFILNTFIIKKDMDEDVPEEKRTGDILFYRDKRKSVFNYWVKSLLSGIKSAYNLEKLEAKMTKKELRKQQKLSRREAKRQRRAEKRHERG